MYHRVPYNPVNWRPTTATAARASRPRSLCPAIPSQGAAARSYDDAEPHHDSNHWSCSENSRNNAWLQLFSNGNSNNNNKYNSLTVHPVAEPADYVPASFVTSVWEAYHDCLRGKMRSTQAVEYMPQAARDIPRLARELWTGDYRPGTSTCFLVRWPKLREVFAAAFRDRIVHHWIALRLEPLFEERFAAQGNVSFNCRRGFGTRKAVEHVAKGMRRVSGNYRSEAWVFRGDLEGFFMSIDKHLLWHLLERFTRRRYHGADKAILLRAVHATVMHRPERDCVLNSPPQWWRALPRNKSLFTSESGMPIGNLTTQLFANFLMSFFVAFVAWTFRRKEYCLAQFVDDFIIICADKAFLLSSIPTIEAFLRDKLHLTLHRDKRYLQPVAHGVLFVGTYIKPARLYLSNRTIGRMTDFFRLFAEILNRDDLNAVEVRHLECVANSYLGFCTGRRTYALRRRLIDGLPAPFWHYFYVKGHYQSIRHKIQKLIN